MVRRLKGGRKIASYADTYYLPITTHDCIGPVALWAAAHLMMHIPNAMIMEMVRGYVEGWYNDVVTDQIRIEDGFLSLDANPASGIKLRDEFVADDRCRIEIDHRRTKLSFGERARRA